MGEIQDKNGNGNKIKWIGIICCLAVALAGLIGWREWKERQEYRQVVDRCAAVLLALDRDSALFDMGLEAVGEYLEQPDRQKLQEVRNKVQKIIKELEETQDAIVPCTMEENFAASLEKWQIDPEEYLLFADSRSSELENYLRELNYMDEYMGFEEIDDLLRENFRFMYRNIADSQKIVKEYYYCAINYLFAGREGRELAYVRRQILEKLTSFESEAGVWYEDRETAEQRGSVCLDQLSALAAELSEHLSEAQEELDETEEEER